MCRKNLIAFKLITTRLYHNMAKKINSIIQILVAILFLIGCLCLILTPAGKKLQAKSASQQRLSLGFVYRPRTLRYFLKQFVTQRPVPETLLRIEFYSLNP